MKIEDKIEKLLNDHNGVIKTEDVVKAGISRITLGELVKKGKLGRTAHGQYIALICVNPRTFLLSL